jgi:hypothetical protein
MLLAIHAIRRLPSNPIIGAPIEPEASHNVLFGWLVTLYAFGGPIYPFILR